ncbi:MAG: RNA-binding protein [Myxococcota bacterium]
MIGAAIRWYSRGSRAHDALAGAEPISSKVFVGNLNYRTTRDELVSFLGPAGTIVDAFLPTDRESGRPRGFAFVTFSSPEEAAACVEQFNGAELSGRRLNINPAEERGRGRPSERGGPGRGRPSERGGPGRGRPGERPSREPRRDAPIAEFKRGSRRPGESEAEGPPRPRFESRTPRRDTPRRDGPPRPFDGPPRRSGPPPDVEAPDAQAALEAEFEARRFQDESGGAEDAPVERDEWGAPVGGDWQRGKKKKAKGSRRGLRGKKRDL